MNYEQTLDFLYAQLPMYQRVGASAFKKELTNIIALCNALGNPQNKFKSVHIAGTNGKGSTAHILSAIYQNNNYKVGLYTSPHLVDFRERIKINGELCSKEFVIEFVRAISSELADIKPSFFEITVAMAFSYFAEQNVDVAIIETGLGGRLDSTNVLTPLASIITSIGLDHLDMLGDTLARIAFEKAGIIKSNVPVVIGKLPEEAEKVVVSTALECNSKLYHKGGSNYETDLLGEHQQWNINTAVRCTEVLNEVLPVSDADTILALQNVCVISNFQGRWQILRENPLIVCDVAHNEQGLKLALSQLKSPHSTHYILGFVNDKDLEKIIPLFPVEAQFSFVKPNIPRGLDAHKCLNKFEECGYRGQAFETIEDALNANLSLVEKPIYIGGSNFVVADLLKAQNHNPALI